MQMSGLAVEVLAGAVVGSTMRTATLKEPLDIAQGAYRPGRPHGC